VSQFAPSNRVQISTKTSQKNLEEELYVIPTPRVFTQLISVYIIEINSATKCTPNDICTNLKAYTAATGRCPSIPPSICYTPPPVYFHITPSSGLTVLVVTTRAVESVRKTSDSDSFIKAQYVLITVNLSDVSSPPRESSGYCLDL
jgi:hypothetical protein